MVLGVFSRLTIPCDGTKNGGDRSARRHRYVRPTHWRTRAVRPYAASLLSRFRAVLDGTTDTDEPLDVYSLMSKFTTGAAVELCPGTRGSAYTAKAPDQAVDAADAITASSLTYPRWLPVPAVRRARAADHTLQVILGRHVHAARHGSCDDAGLLQRYPSRFCFHAACWRKCTGGRRRQHRPVVVIVSAARIRSDPSGSTPCTATTPSLRSGYASARLWACTICPRSPGP